MQTTARPKFDALYADLDGAMTRDRGRFLRKLRELRGERTTPEQLAALSDEIARSEAELQARGAAARLPGRAAGLGAPR